MICVAKMALKFLRVTPEEAVTTLDECINSGYATLSNIIQDYQQHTSEEQQRASYWDKLWKSWVDETFKKLKEIYISPSRAYHFAHAKTNRYSTTGDKPFTSYDHALEAKMQFLKEYYDFILEHAHPKIMINGDINLQMGENISYENKK